MVKVTGRRRGHESNAACVAAHQTGNGTANSQQHSRMRPPSHPVRWGHLRDNVTSESRIAIRNEVTMTMGLLVKACRKADNR